jgi:transposase
MLVRFEELTDDQWKLLVSSIPAPAHTGRPRADDKSTINGILYVLMSGCRWMDMPPKYGSYKQNSLGTTQEVEYQRCMEKYYEFLDITWLYFWIDKHRRLICR